MRKLPNKNAEGGRIQKLWILWDNFVAERDEKRNQNAILMNLIGQQQQMMAQQWTIFREIINKNN